jgi:hypothetical protein
MAYIKVRKDSFGRLFYLVIKKTLLIYSEPTNKSDSPPINTEKTQSNGAGTRRRLGGSRAVTCEEIRGRSEDSAVLELSHVNRYGESVKTLRF